jgi:hypothetical protein
MEGAASATMDHSAASSRAFHRQGLRVQGGSGDGEPAGDERWAGEDADRGGNPVSLKSSACDDPRPSDGVVPAS